MRRRAQRQRVSSHPSDQATSPRCAASHETQTHHTPSNPKRSAHSARTAALPLRQEALLARPGNEIFSAALVVLSKQIGLLLNMVSAMGIASVMAETARNEDKTEQRPVQHMQAAIPEGNWTKGASGMLVQCRAQAAGGDVGRRTEGRVAVEVAGRPGRSVGRAGQSGGRVSRGHGASGSGRASPRAAKG